MVGPVVLLASSFDPDILLLPSRLGNDVRDHPEHIGRIGCVFPVPYYFGSYMLHVFESMAAFESMWRTQNENAS